MEDWQQRVVAERDELSAKICKLKAFTYSETCKSLPVNDQQLLFVQLKSMETYCQVLDLRVMNFVQGIMS